MLSASPRTFVGNGVFFSIILISDAYKPTNKYM